MSRDWAAVCGMVGLMCILSAFVSVVYRVSTADMKQMRVQMEPTVYETNGMVYHLWTTKGGGIEVVNITKDKAAIEALSVSR